MSEVPDLGPVPTRWEGDQPQPRAWWAVVAFPLAGAAGFAAGFVLTSGTTSDRLTVAGIAAFLGWGVAWCVNLGVSAFHRARSRA